MKHITTATTILYVNNQQLSTDFYTKLFRQEPDLNVPGMTEYGISDTCKIGLMPYSSIENILSNYSPKPSLGGGIARCELYLYVTNVEQEFDNAIRIGAKLISAINERDWGDKACYFSDPDGHIIAFAERL